MARQHGSHGKVSIDPAGGSTYADVASINKWSASFAKDKADVTCFGDTNKVKVLGLPEIDGAFSGIWDPTTTPDQVFDVVMGATAVGLKLTPSTLTATYFLSGPAYIDGSIDVDAKGAITIAGTWSAAGSFAWAP